MRPPVPGQNRFGGWLHGPRQTAKGFFYPQKIRGQWFLIDPEGALFFSRGINDISLNAFLPGRKRE
ncbi:MAG: hypothetical protein PHS41_12060, partial [Victivallaceae bacterium]|nr:hypothetical protein [Victivallaceae bacterium]